MARTYKAISVYQSTEEHFSFRTVLGAHYCVIGAPSESDSAYLQTASGVAGTRDVYVGFFQGAVEVDYAQVTGVWTSDNGLPIHAIPDGLTIDAGYEIYLTEERQQSSSNVEDGQICIPLSVLGTDGEDGWSPVLSTVADDDRRVHRVIDWVGGEGDKPLTGQYVGETGLVDDIADAVDIRGGPGEPGEADDGDNGWTAIPALIADGERIVKRVIDWTGGGGDKPLTGQYVGETGLVDDIADAVNVRGKPGLMGIGGKDGWCPIFAVVPDGERRVHRVVNWVCGNLETFFTTTRTYKDTPGTSFFDLLNHVAFNDEQNTVIVYHPLTPELLTAAVGDFIEVMFDGTTYNWTITNILQSSHGIVYTVDGDVDLDFGAGDSATVTFSRGDRPPIGQYLGPEGLVDDIADATDIRGARGLPGIGTPGNDGLSLFLSFSATGEGIQSYTATVGANPGVTLVAGSLLFWFNSLPSDSFINDLQADDMLIVSHDGNSYEYTVTSMSNSGILYVSGTDPTTYASSGDSLIFISDTWHEDLTDTDKYIRFARALTRPPETSDAWSIGRKFVGGDGEDGWSPVFSTVIDGDRRVHRVIDWVGGEGDKPTTGQYVGATGLVTDIADAVDIRGGPGEPGEDATLPSFTTRGPLIATSTNLPQNLPGSASDRESLNDDFTWTLSGNYSDLTDTTWADVLGPNLFERHPSEGRLAVPYDAPLPNVSGLWAVAEDGTESDPEIYAVFIPWGMGSVETQTDWFGSRHVIHFGRASGEGAIGGDDVVIFFRKRRDYDYKPELTVTAYGGTLPSNQCRIKIYLAGVFPSSQAAQETIYGSKTNSYSTTNTTTSLITGKSFSDYRQLKFIGKDSSGGHQVECTIPADNFNASGDRIRIYSTHGSAVDVDWESDTTFHLHGAYGNGRLQQIIGLS